MKKESIERALARRQQIDWRQTNALRIVDDVGDACPGYIIEDYAGHWLVQTRDVGFPSFLHQWQPKGCRSVWWKQLDKDNKQPPRWILGEHVRTPFLIKENGLRYEIDLTSGYSQGIFLDQRDSRLRVRESVQPGQCILNCFAYTCAFSVAAATAGAITSSLDLSRPYLDWGKRNFAANGMMPEDHHFCRGDVMEWLAQFDRKKRRFHGIILDPPTFSRSKAGVFQVEKDFPTLAAAAMRLLEPQGWLLCSSNDRQLHPRRFIETIRDGAQRARRRIISMEQQAMPPDFTGDPYLKSVWFVID